MNKIYMATCLLLFVPGCFNVAPKLAEVKAEVKADVEATMTAQVGAQGNDLSAKMFDLETRLESKINQTIGKVSGGQVNTGMFAGGALYVTVVCVTLITALAFVIIYLLGQKKRWRLAYRTAREFVNAPSELRSRLYDRGLSEVAEEDITHRA
jgi:hypothetical protein